MNKRWNDRRLVSLDLVINYPALGLLRGRAINISDDGMFIKTAAISLCHYANIEITFNLPGLSRTPVQLQAIIIHSSDNGIGIMFTDHEGSNGLALINQFTTKSNNYYQRAC